MTEKIKVVVIGANDSINASLTKLLSEKQSNIVVVNGDTTEAKGSVIDFLKPNLHPYEDHINDLKAMTDSSHCLHIKKRKDKRPKIAYYRQFEKNNKKRNLKL